MPLHRRRPLLVAICSVVLLVGCGSPSGLLSHAELRDFQRARARWQQTRPVDYSYVSNTLCFCPPEVYEPRRVEVRGDTVSAVRTLDGTLVPRSQWGFRTTIDSLFVRALDLQRDASAADIRIEYDPNYGYPTKIESVPQKGILDAGSTTYASDLRPLPVP